MFSFSFIIDDSMKCIYDYVHTNNECIEIHKKKHKNYEDLFSLYLLYPSLVFIKVLLINIVETLLYIMTQDEGFPQSETIYPVI